MAQQLPVGRNTVAAEAPMEFADIGGQRGPNNLCDPPHLPGFTLGSHSGKPVPLQKAQATQTDKTEILLLFNSGFPAQKTQNGSDGGGCRCPDMSGQGVPCRVGSKACQSWAGTWQMPGQELEQGAVVA